MLTSRAATADRAVIDMRSQFPVARPCRPHGTSRAGTLVMSRTSRLLLDRKGEFELGAPYLDLYVD